jgi:hypothetical protein
LRVVVVKGDMYKEQKAGRGVKCVICNVFRKSLKDRRESKNEEKQDETAKPN